MKIAHCLTLVIFSFILASCVNDKVAGTAEVADSIKQKAAPKSPTTTSTRPTENIKVNMAGESKPTKTKKTGATLNATDKQQDPSRKENRYTEEERDKMQAIRDAKQAQNEESHKAAPKKIAPATPVSTEGALPSACDLVSKEFIAEALGIVEARELFVKDGSGSKAIAKLNSRSCFFKWDYKGNVNAGVLVQVQRNPLPDEFPDWASYYIRTKRDAGDQMPDGSGSYRYKDFPGMGIAGAYSYDLARYTWRTDTGNVFMIAFNIQTALEAEQLIWAEKIGKEVMRNFNKTNK